VTEAAIGKQREAAVGGGWPWNPDEFEVEDFVAAFIRFEGGLTMVLKESWAMHADTLGPPFILGTKGARFQVARAHLAPLERSL
jgi:predicted dehydrogenase